MACRGPLGQLALSVHRLMIKETQYWLAPGISFTLVLRDLMLL